MLIVCARARRLEVKGEGVRAVVIGGHGRVLHRVLTDDVVAEVARILPVGILIVLLRDGHDLVAPRRIAPSLKYFCSPSLTNMLVLMASVKTLSLVTTRTLCTFWL